jgi:hypothetical protein
MITNKNLFYLKRQGAEALAGLKGIALLLAPHGKDPALLL